MHDISPAPTSSAPYRLPTQSATQPPRTTEGLLVFVALPVFLGLGLAATGSVVAGAALTVLVAGSAYYLARRRSRRAGSHDAIAPESSVAR